MALTVTHFQPEEIDQAGRVLVHVPGIGEDDREWLEAAHLVNDWRASHAHPLSVFRTNLRRRANRGAAVAQRLKRLPSIIAKLQRLPRIPLSQMQDIGGCRVVLSSAGQAFNVAADLMASSIEHKLVRYDNYIEEPRRSGYRGLHLVYFYNSKRSSKWQGIKTEVQLRSMAQHQWATAVETVGTFIGQELKSGRGDSTWLRFFALMSNVIAQKEGTSGVPGTPSSLREIQDEIRECDRQRGISEQLEAFQRVTSRLQSFRGASRWVVIELDLETRRLTGDAFKASDWESANSLYIEKEVELRETPREVVLVSTDSLSALRRTYPNYFADLTAFRGLVRQSTG